MEYPKFAKSLLDGFSNGCLEKGFLLILTLIAAFFSFYKLTACDLWYDEAVNFFIAKSLKFPPFLCLPRFYYWVLHFFIKFKENEFFIRLPSAILGTAVVPLFYLLVKKLSIPSTAIVSTLFLTISPLRIWYSQEASVHIFAFFLSVLSTYSFLLFIQKTDFKRALFLFFSNFLAISTSYHSLLLLAMQFLFLVIFRNRFSPKILRYYLFVLLGVFGFYSLHWTLFVNSLRFLKGGFWIGEVNWFNLKYSIENFILGYNGTSLFYNLSFLLFLTSLGLLFWRRKMDLDVAFGIIFGLLPLLIVWVVHRIFIPVYLDRHNMIFMPSIYFLIALSCTILRKKIGRIIFVSVYLFIMGKALFFYEKNSIFVPLKHHIGVHKKRSIRPVVEFIKNRALPEDIIAHTNPVTRLPFGYYWRGKKQYFFVSKLDLYWKRIWGLVPSDDASSQSKDEVVYVETFEDWSRLGNRIWIVAATWARDNQVDENGRCVEDALICKGYRCTLVKKISGVVVKLLERKSCRGSQT